MNKLLLTIIISAFLYNSCSTSEKTIILSFEKEISDKYCNPDSPNFDTIYCIPYVNWVLDSISIKEILNISEITDFIEIDAAYSTLPCEYKGNAMIKGELYIFWINAGGYTTLSGNGKTLFTVYRKKNNFFLEKLWKPTDG
jgi:hypothetical protein